MAPLYKGHNPEIDFESGKNENTDYIDSIPIIHMCNVICRWIFIYVGEKKCFTGQLH